MPHDVKHLFACPAHPTTLILSDLWSIGSPLNSHHGISQSFVLLYNIVIKVHTILFLANQWTPSRNSGGNRKAGNLGLDEPRPKARSVGWL